MTTDDQTEMDLGEVSLAEAIKAGGVEPPKEKWARTLAECVDVIADAFVRDGSEGARAIELAQCAVLALAEYQGGRQMYLPRGTALRNALRDRVIYHLARRGNTNELAAQYRLTTRRVEQIIAQQHAINVRRVQPSLFSE